MAKILYTDDEYRQMFYDCGFYDLPNVKGNRACPYHTDKHPSMSIDIRNGLYHCFSCGASGSIVKLYKDTFGHPFERSNSLTADMLINLAKKRFEVTKNIPRTFTINEFRYPYVAENYTKWMNYRGIKSEVAKAAGIWYGGVEIVYVDDEGNEKKYKVMNRVMIPIYNREGKLSSLEMRYPFTGQESESFKSSVNKCLYPKNSSTNLLYEDSKLNRHQKLYILEGLMDCLAFRSLTGIQNSTTIFGATVTNKQKEILNEFDEVCYVYNNDAPGIASVESIRKSYKGKYTTLKPMGQFDDVGEMAIAKVEGIREWLMTEK